MARRTNKSAGRIEVLHVDEALLVVNKPAGLATIPGRGQETSLVELLRGGEFGEELRLVHRIDVDTSGVVLLARDLATQRALARAFAKREVHKEYWAIIEGRPGAERGTIDAPIQEHPRRKERMRIHKQGRASVTEWELAESWQGFSLLRCRPLTGRRHQIRVHLAHAGLSLVVDPLYGGGKALYLSRLKPDYRPSKTHPEYPLIGRVSLHARSLRLQHPGTGEDFEVAADPPKDFRAVMNQLRRLGQEE